MRHQEPESTLSWVAAHKFDQLFNAKYCSGKLTMKEYLDLIEVSISHVIYFFAQNPIEWYQFRAKYFRRVRLKELNKLRSIIYHNQWKSKKGIGCFATVIANSTGHRFSIGTRVVVINVFRDSAYVKETSVCQGEEVPLDDLSDDTAPKPLKEGPTKSTIRNYVPGEIYMGPAPKPIKPARTGE